LSKKPTLNTDELLGCTYKQLGFFLPHFLFQLFPVPSLFQHGHLLEGYIVEFMQTVALMDNLTALVRSTHVLIENTKLLFPAAFLIVPNSV
jgi:hypothetical protein